MDELTSQMGLLTTLYNTKRFSVPYAFLMYVAKNDLLGQALCYPFKFSKADGSKKWEFLEAKNRTVFYGLLPAGRWLS